MASSTTLRNALLLLASFHASLSWDASNIWFPDTNNPVFYNMTFYPQAGQSVQPESPSDDFVPSTEPPKIDKKNLIRQNSRPAVFNPIAESGLRAPVRPTNPPPRQYERPTQNRQTTRAPVIFQRGQLDAEIAQRAGDTRTSIERARQNRNRQPLRPVSNARTEEGVKTSPQSGSRRIYEEPRQFIRTQQNRQPVRNPQPVGIKSLDLMGDPSSVQNQMNNNNDDNNNNNNKPNRQPSRNRLRRTEYDGSTAYNQNFAGNQESMVGYNGDMGHFRGRNLRQFPEQGRWSGNQDTILSPPRPEERLEITNNNGIERNFPRPTERPVVSAEENRRNWNNEGATGSDARDLVEENVISDIETSSPKATGPSQCVWAIISCCKPSSPEIRYMCFEALGCHGAFWDTNPCSTEMTLAAVQATANFYNVPPTVEN